MCDIGDIVKGYVMNPQKDNQPPENTNKTYIFPTKQLMTSTASNQEESNGPDLINNNEPNEEMKGEKDGNTLSKFDASAKIASRKYFTEKCINKLMKPINFLLNLLPAIGDDREMDQTMLEDELRIGAYNIVQLIIPVSLCMSIVVAFQLAIAVNVNTPSRTLVYGILSKSSISVKNVLLVGLVNAAVIICLIIISTIILIVLFKYRCDKVIIIWLFVSSGLLVFLAASTYIVEILTVRQLVIDWFTFVFCVWNYGSLGLMVIHWKGPLRVQQAYHILNSAVVAIILIRFLPEWSTWIILSLLSIYDIIAVLCPKGPLRILIEMAKERGEINLPSLIYSSSMIWTVGMADVNKKTESDEKKDGNNKKKLNISEATVDKNGFKNEEEIDSRSEEPPSRINTGFIGPMPLHPPPQDQEECDNGSSAGSQEDDRRGFKIGLGDLVFYSVLVGRAAFASKGNWVIIMSCFVAILMGLCLTSLILGIVRRALPALPISIFFGLAFYFASQYIIAPYIEVLNVNQVIL